ncbi:amino acid ABC transporter substrate-binding protein [Methylobacterium gnaphalii]|uniref:Amino acid ABC transporter substrate-binding protein n=1 Tax=Methylobacterium gnaphalii TaxID=1010610 RepID=A0A512JKN1_9HYPH|nr:amino acid ABC transporter substrate-binding protein [Methylobacterium gnaphalii]GEP10515.1 amino acid ABC transporter substrate-binding protein [Methylobacterium gnaphalii]GJD69258.1 Glutamate/aspartate import solute-binding protein [Methylobacterium gnaphalii]GLS47921.1 amino acid ABC transporter substrate-binding protein [Methylobacterium gnaphalii]
MTLAGTRGSAWLSGALAAVLMVVAATPGQAVEILTGTIKKAAERGEVVIGVRASSVPFSFVEKLGQSERPVGYAVDICQEIADDIARASGRAGLKIRYEPVTSETRIAAVTSGKIDLECGSTTTNAERRKSVGFSPVMFISATKLLVKRNAGIASYRDLGGRKVVVTAGTTNEAALRDILAKSKIQAEILVGKDHAESFAMVKDGRADAFATDDVLLYGLKADAGAEGSTYTVLPEKLSFEPYAIMFRKDDPALSALVTSTFERLAETRELRWTYEKWFIKRLPNGERLDIPMSEELKTAFAVMGLRD